MILTPRLEIKTSHFWQSLWYSENGLLIIFMEYDSPTLGQCVSSLPQLSGVCFYSGTSRSRNTLHRRKRQLFWVLAVAIMGIFSVSGPQSWVCLINQSLLIWKAFFLFFFIFLIQEPLSSLLTFRLHGWQGEL